MGQTLVALRIAVVVAVCNLYLLWRKKGFTQYGWGQNRSAKFNYPR